MRESGSLLSLFLFQSEQQKQICKKDHVTEMLILARTQRISTLLFFTYHSHTQCHFYSHEKFISMLVATSIATSIVSRLHAGLGLAVDSGLALPYYIKGNYS